MIRKALAGDLPVIFGIYESARKFMRENGNPTQWGNDRPAKALICADVDAGNLYVCDDGGIYAVFAFIIGDDPTYRVIENGAWHYELPYGVIHRVASSGRRSGVMREIADYCSRHAAYLRIDTHADNRFMLGALTRYGFRECGTIYVDNRTPRVAFDYLKEN